MNRLNANTLVTPKKYLMSRFVILICLIFLLSGCGKPIPENKLDYVGQWQSEEMRLFIARDGTVAYKRWKNGVTTSVNGPITEFIEDDFEVGLLFLTTRFEVSTPPKQVDGIWQMVVDGVVLTKVGE
ncbi:hypothetical protein [Zooshikella harenae]|uniref:Lipocalin-like domain-containing protein n=1 Tax=Zooshikella harenae TaxID=2827238 RepID=A0ABS5Z660_9GAMM|nr:hypothetical protein [Zooshikella harenae]MBU2709541.1 hypothetical protein [Zooshikella harenae]